MRTEETIKTDNGEETIVKYNFLCESHVEDVGVSVQNLMRIAFQNLHKAVLALQAAELVDDDENFEGAVRPHFDFKGIHHIMLDADALADQLMGLRWEAINKAEGGIPLSAWREATK